VSPTRFRGDDASQVILSRICVAPLATADGATLSRKTMIFFVTIVLIVVVALAAYAGYMFGARGNVRDVVSVQPSLAEPRRALAALTVHADSATAPASDPDSTEMERVGIEKARIIRSRDAETAALRQNLADRDARADDDAGSKRELERVSAELDHARNESARYRQLVVDIENNAPPPILSGAGEPDDLKLIVGIGPVLERMLHNLGVTTFRQVARWSDRDSAEFDAKLPEFPGRIVRDQWVTQARELHQAKFGELPSDRPPRP
jgi:predicted flap endonuclease-1-like 5' DNA nuclease